MMTCQVLVLGQNTRGVTGILAKPLIELLKKDQIFVWTLAHAEAFALLKAALCSAQVLALPDFNQPFHIETDASSSRIGAIL